MTLGSKEIRLHDPTALKASAAQAASRVRDVGAVVILRGAFSGRSLLDAASILAEEGLGVIEVTLNSHDALANVALLRAELGDAALIGAGTCRDASQLRAALEAGAEFTVAPNLDPQSVELATRRGHLHLPGVYTGSEIAEAHSLGATLQKLFPCDVGGPALVRAMAAPFDDVEFVAVGGVNAANLGDYFAAGAVAVGLGSSITAHLEDLASLRAEARVIRSGIDAARERALDGRASGARA